MLNRTLLQKRFYNVLILPITMVIGTLFSQIGESVFSGIGAPPYGNFTDSTFWERFTTIFAISIIVGMAGVFTRCPFSSLRLWPWLRGAVLGVLIGLPHAIASSEIYADFWFVLVGCSLYGLFVDVVSTRFGGEGRVLLAD